MAGSYSHLTTKDGHFRGTDLIDNLGDAAEALEECWGMIQVLAGGNRDRIETARRGYRAGLYGTVCDSHRWDSGTNYGPSVPDEPGDEE